MKLPMNLTNTNYKKSIYYFIPIIFLTFFTLASLLFYFDNYNLIAFSDHDEGYLLEQLILKIDKFEMDRVQSIEAAYGVEFYYLKYLFNILGYFFNMNEILIYYVVIFFHSILALVAFYLIFKIFDLLKIDKIFNVVFFTTILSIPEIFNYSLSMKPDLNLLFFSLTFVIYYFIRFNTLNLKKDFYLLILFLSISFTIKFWCLPFVITFLFLNYDFRNDLKKYRYFFLLLITIFFFFINLYFLNLRNFLIADEEFLKFVTSSSSLLIILKFFDDFFYTILIFVNIILSIPFLIFLFSKNKLNFIFSFYLFFIVWFLLFIPFSFDFTTFFKTLYAHTYATNLNFNDNLTQFENPIIIYFRDLLSFKINSLILIFLALSPLIYLRFKNRLFLNIKIFNYLLLLSFFLFIFKYSLTFYNNQFPAKYLYFIFVTIFVFYLIDRLIKINKNFSIIIYLLIFINLINFSKNFQQYNSTFNYFNKKNLHHEMLNTHYKKYFNEISTLYICGGPYPANLKENKFNFSFIRSDKCSEQNFYNKFTSNDLILINSVNVTEIFFDRYKFVDKVKIKKVGRFGNLDYTTLVFFKKTS